jgi:hypothetical protein
MTSGEIGAVRALSMIEVESARWVIRRPSELEADSQPSLNIGPH